MTPFLTLGLVALLALAIRLFIGHLNHNRIREYLRINKGGRNISITWKPFGAGWFGEKDSIIYQVRYTDRDGATHEATCKTAFFSGVYFTNDIVIHQGSGGRPFSGVSSQPARHSAVNTDMERLLAENRLLREENERLRVALKKCMQQ